MNRITAWLLHCATLIVSVTGLLYAYMHYVMKPVDPFSVVNHPLEPYMLQLHLIASPVLVFLIGMILHSHIFFKLENGARSGKRSGLLLALLFGVMALSGYLLQVFTITGHRFLFWLHLLSGILWALGYAAHQLSSVRLKRAMRAQRAGAVLTIALVLFALFAAGKLFAETEPLQREAQAMGTTLRITAYGEDSARVLQNSEQVLRSVEDTEAQLSTWREDSELSRLNRQPLSQAFALSPSLCDLLQRANAWTRKTGGAFDPGMGPLAVAWGIHDHFRIPTKAEIEAALQNTGMRRLKLNANDCTASRTAEVLIDPGAFGKGEAMDRAGALAQFPMLLDFGGQILVAGPTADHPWQVTIADPADRSKDSDLRVSLQFGSLSTSGGSERDGYVNGRRISHHIDPRSGQPVEFFGSVTVWRPRAFEADVLSTALFVMGPRKGIAWANQHQVAACFLVPQNGRLLARKSHFFVDNFN